MPDAPISPLAKMFQIAHGYLPKPVALPNQMMGAPHAQPPAGGAAGGLVPGLTPEIAGGLGVGGVEKVQPGVTATGSLTLGQPSPGLPPWVQGMMKGLR